MNRSLTLGHSSPDRSGLEAVPAHADSLLFIATFKSINRSKLSGATLRSNVRALDYNRKM